MWPRGFGLIQTSLHAGGMTMPRMRARVRSSVIRRPSVSRWTKPSPRRSRRKPGPEVSRYSSPFVFTRRCDSMTRTERSPGVELLRPRRGDEDVTFGDVADHLVDYMDRHPESRKVVDDLAAFLARVEGIDHDHDRSPDRGLPSP